MATNRNPTLGQAIKTLRIRHPMTQKELANRILRPDGKAISAQYLNDIEHDRRTPDSDHLIQQLAEALGTDAALLTFIAGTLPPEIRDLPLDEETFRRALAAFLREAKSGPASAEDVASAG